MTESKTRKREPSAWAWIKGRFRSLKFWGRKNK